MPGSFQQLSADSSATGATTTLPLSLTDLHSSFGMPSSTAVSNLGDATDPGAFLNLASMDTSRNANLGMSGQTPPFFQDVASGRGGAAEGDSWRGRAPRKASPFTASSYRVQHAVPGMAPGHPAAGQFRSFSVPTRFGGFQSPALQAVPEDSMQGPSRMRTAGTIGCPADYTMDDDVDDSLDLDSLAEPFDFLHDQPAEAQPESRSQSTGEPSGRTQDVTMGQRGDARSASTSMLGFPPPGRLNYLTPPELRKGKGGRQPALDPRLDPNVDPKRAKRILANRLSAARSKMKQKSHVDGLRERANTLTKQRTHLQDEVRTLEKTCQETARENEMVMKQLQGLREQNLDKRSSSLSHLWSGMAMDVASGGLPAYDQSFLDPNPLLPPQSGSLPAVFSAPASAAF
ncbi:hypothetical protein WJX84_003355 [Apatococcus fuscideae]|uniref:BZIP domain-containing protein n=1 Tax=Apatococcus fuscideae TaxID=2026836 RepID=A0AAW1TI07_9CHLO